MSKQIFLRQLPLYLDKEVLVQGWIKTMRQQKNIIFIQLHDGSQVAPCQLVITDAKLIETFPSGLSTDCTIQVSGKVVKNQRGVLEIEITEQIQLIGKPHDASIYPISKTSKSLEVIRSLSHLKQRTGVHSSLMRMRSVCSFAIREYYDSLNMAEVNTPLITSSDCEGAGEVFELKASSDSKEKLFFKKPVFLTVSGQLHLEASACAGIAEKGVFVFGPTFRAEHSNTSRHLAEFWMVEPELIHIDLDDLVNNAFMTIKACCDKLLRCCTSEIAILDKYAKGHESEFTLQTTLLERLTKVKECKDIRKIKYTDAVEKLKEYYPDLEWGDDLSSEMEKKILSLLDSPVVAVTHYPESLKAFYMKRDDKDPKTVQNVDILVEGIGELVGGSMREHNYDILYQKMSDRKMNLEEYQWYLDLRKFGSVPHGGYGIGFERLIQFVTGIKNIRDVVPFPRAYGMDIHH